MTERAAIGRKGSTNMSLVIPCNRHILMTIQCWRSANIPDSNLLLVQCWQRSPMSAAVRQRWPIVGRPTNHLKWLANGWPANIVLPTQCQHWPNVGKTTINLSFLRTVGKRLANGWLDSAAIPTSMLGKHWYSDQFLFFLKIHWQMIGNWSDSQCLMLMLAQYRLTNQYPTFEWNFH